MPRGVRIIEPYSVQHVINRGNRRQEIFRDAEEYEDFIGLLGRAADRHPVLLLAFCLMPNHWHLVLGSNSPRAVFAYMHWLTSTQVRRLHRRRGTTGEGHIYQERYRNVTVRDERQFIMLCRYVEANARAAGLVERAQDWPYSSLSRPTSHDGRALLTPWPIPRPENWTVLVNTP